MLQIATLLVIFPPTCFPPSFDWQDITDSAVVNKQLLNVLYRWLANTFGTFHFLPFYFPPLISPLSHSRLLTSWMFTHRSVKMPLNCTSCAAIKYTWQKEREKKREKEWEKLMIDEAVRLKVVPERFLPYWRKQRDDEEALLHITTPLPSSFNLWPTY